MIARNKFVAETFIANGSEWKVSECGEWIMLVCDLDEEETILNHVNPANAWVNSVRAAAEEHRCVMLGIN